MAGLPWNAVYLLLQSNEGNLGAPEPAWEDDVHRNKNFRNFLAALLLQSKNPINLLLEQSP